MKRLTAVSGAALAIIVLSLFVTCNIDPDGGGKPAKLSDDATYEEALAKLDEIAAYCDAHPGPENDMVKNGVEVLRASTFAYMQESYWSGKTAKEGIAVINELIDDLA
jgi:hypothetical protein